MKCKWRGRDKRYPISPSHLLPLFDLLALNSLCSRAYTAISDFRGFSHVNMWSRIYGVVKLNISDKSSVLIIVHISSSILTGRSHHLYSHRCNHTYCFYLMTLFISTFKCIMQMYGRFGEHHSLCHLVPSQQGTIIYLLVECFFVGMPNDLRHWI